MAFESDYADHVDGASSCQGKVKYREASAQKAAVTMARKKKEPFEAYQCRHCDGWHIGHPRFSQWTDVQKLTVRVQNISLTMCTAGMDFIHRNGIVIVGDNPEGATKQ